ncbi:MAG: peroxiredoxin [Crocosphaera sp.]|uniref:peroxidase family protein n=1 Tax=Crocosphaera sp. TaxID=2729996 RepID=UPI00258656CD|nr:peroxidase family protein [Crocosphaera sp.]MCH2243153.1 peroxiredoxin [Crocosphaera sp.]
MNKTIIITLTSITTLSVGVLFPVNAFDIRNIDGTGNNISNPSYGSAGSDLIRLSDVDYEDGFSIPRGGDPSVLPSPRAISNAVSAQSFSIPNAKGVSDWVWQWGQFLDHDLSLSPSGTESFNIPVPQGDEFFDPFNTGTAEISLNRSESNTDGSGVRQQFNEITAYIDASNIYASESTRTNFLRSNDGTGKLRATTADNGEKLLIKNTDNLENETGGSPNSEDFFVSGDVRANEQVGLLTAHTLFMREHNRLADELKTRLDNGETALVDKRDAAIADTNNNVNDEGDFIFEAARKVVGAQMQVITYEEWLPIVLGENPLVNYSGYNDTVNAGIANEFSTAAFRFGHTMLSPNLNRVDNNNNIVASLSLQESFFDPDQVQQNGVDTILKGLAFQKAQEVDTFLVDDVRNFLFGAPGAGGFDLASLNLQRGRDHGIPDINTVRRALGLSGYSTFLELTGGDEDLANALASIYSDIDEVDLWIAGLAEQKVNGGLLGETFSSILIDQFSRSRDGDRFFYLNELAHLNILDPTLETLTLSEIIRRNSTIDNIQDNAFLVSSVPEADNKLGLLTFFLLGLIGSHLRSKNRK